MSDKSINIDDIAVDFSPSSILDDKGREILDQTPVVCPLNFERPMPLHLRIKQQILAVQEEMRHQNEFDTPEEADDFVIDDGENFNSKYEVDFDHIQNGFKKEGAATSEDILPHEEACADAANEVADNVE